METVSAFHQISKSPTCTESGGNDRDAEDSCAKYGG